MFTTLKIMKRVVIVHQWMSGPAGDWRPWVKAELEKLGYEVLLPDMPNMGAPAIEQWVAHLTRVVGRPDSATYFIGHSIGCQAILRYLETVESPVAGAVFVAGWFYLENLEDEETEKIAKPWIETPINIEKIKMVLPKSTLIISDDDPFGAFEENKRKFAELGSKVIVLQKAGHITEEDGFSEMPILIEEFQRIAS